MVVIEQEPTAAAEEAKQSNTSEKSTPSGGGGSTLAPPTGYASDGYETASESELNDAEVEQNGGRGLDRNTKSSTNAVTDHNTTPSATNPDNSVQEAQQQQCETNQDQLNEKALAEANDAKIEGNSLFKEGHYEEALSKYELALQTAPDIPSSTEIRSICHSNCAACFLKLGKFEETIKECSKALELNPKYIKALIRRAEAHEKLEHYEEAIADMGKVLEVEPLHDQAKKTIVRLKPLADEKREKLKEEMIGKLKEMGNSILGRFGMSVDNFKAVKDPNTGSYSISFQR